MSGNDRDVIDIKSVREALRNFDFSGLFTEYLGWNHPGHTNNTVKVKKANISYAYIAEIKSVPVLFFEKYWEQFKDKSNRAVLHKELKKRHEKNLVIFSDRESFFSLSYLPNDGSLKIHDYFKGQNGDAFISKLSGIHVSIESEEPSIDEISKRLDDAFNTDKVTNKFYDDFNTGHLDFQKHITGIKNESEKAWYSSVVLNRLMFIWFLQKKMFLDNDTNYLQTKFRMCYKNGQGYYSSFLKILFFEGFAKKPRERSLHAKKILGNIKYLNGGLFTPHPIEERNGDIDIKDKAFEKVFDIFSRYDWHNEDTRGKTNEISPDVLGHIFEKYINYSQRKTLGAYYTPDEITDYIARKNIRKYIVDQVNKRGYNFESIDQCLHSLDADLCKILLVDKDGIINTLSILDPAVGSGAFLIAAMKELFNIYSPILMKMETIKNRTIKGWLDNFRREYISVAYGIKKNIILNNLYGVDVMEEAVEICKLRLFLSLASSALEKQELKPLPNIDFNIMHGNSLIGILREENPFDDVCSQFLDKYKKSVKKYKLEDLTFNELKKIRTKTNELIQNSRLKLDNTIIQKCKDKRVESTKENRQKIKSFHWDFVFNDIIKKGGFDIILTNPPWNKIQFEDKEFIQQYVEDFKKNKTSTNKTKEELNKLLEEEPKRKDYEEQKSFSKFQSNYFKNIYDYQSGDIVNQDGTTKKSSSDINMYRVFLERCLGLLIEYGRMGVVLPSGFGKDDGAVALRRYIFDNIRIEGLIDFQNQGENGKIFDDVASQFTFGLLNLKRDKPEDTFPCRFGERDLKVLEFFPKKNELKQSIKKIKAMSPRDCSIIEFKHPMDEKILEKAMKFPRLGEKLENTWNVDIYGEFHETSDNHLFKALRPKKAEDAKNYFPLYRGGAIYQYEYNYDPIKSSRYVNKNTDKVKNGRGSSFQNKYYQDYRLVFRSIASSTNERSVISSLIPKNCFFFTFSLWHIS